MSLSEESAFEASIVEACAEHEREHRSEPNYRRCVVIHGHFVKFDTYKSLLPAHDTLRYISQFADGDTNAPRIPKVVSSEIIWRTWSWNTSTIHPLQARTSPKGLHGLSSGFVIFQLRTVS